jgi:hypothetical protein
MNVTAKPTSAEHNLIRVITTKRCIDVHILMRVITTKVYIDVHIMRVITTKKCIDVHILMRVITTIFNYYYQWQLLQLLKISKLLKAFSRKTETRHNIRTISK